MEDQEDNHNKIKDEAHVAMHPSIFSENTISENQLSKIEEPQKLVVDLIVEGKTIQVESHEKMVKRIRNSEFNKKPDFLLREEAKNYYKKQAERYGREEVDLRPIIKIKPEWFDKLTQYKENGSPLITDAKMFEVGENVYIVVKTKHELRLQGEIDHPKCFYLNILQLSESGFRTIESIQMGVYQKNESHPKLDDYI